MVIQTTQSFDDLHKSQDIFWMGQNTNHLPAHPKVKEALLKGINEQSYNLYAPPQGMENLREQVLNDLLGDKVSNGTQVLITDGAVEGLYLVCKRLSNTKTTLITSDPTWVWPLNFSQNEGAKIAQIPIYDQNKKYKIDAKALDSQLSQSEQAIIYLIDPLNPLGSCYGLEEIIEIAHTAKKHGALIVHDCTYRDFAFDHHLVRDIYPEKTITTYSFSKWLGIAGLRTGAIVADDMLFTHLIKDQPNILGSNILGQLAAIAAFEVKREWMKDVNRIQRRNQGSIQKMLGTLGGFETVVYPSNGNFLAVDCQESGCSANTIADELLKSGFFIRTSDYHSETLKDVFLKISTTVPQNWVERFCDEFPRVFEKCAGTITN